MSAPPAPLPNVQLSFGPMLIGVFFNMILYGVLLTQVLTYYKSYGHDAKWMKVFVFALFAVETVNTGFDMAIMYQPLIKDYGEKPTFFPTFFVTEPLCIVFVSTPIQLFFAWRIKSLTKSWWIPVFITILAVASFAGGVWTAVMIRIVLTFANKPKLHNSALLWFLASCVADILITISLVMTLSKRKTGFAGTDSVIDKIIRMTIQTGMITAIFAILDVICFMVFPHYAVITGIYFSLLTETSSGIWRSANCIQYVNCLMSTLNARQHLNTQSASGGLSDQRRNNSHGLVGVSSPRTPKQRENFVEHSRHMDSSGTYELDAQKSAYDVESGFAPAREEYGIQVTKVIERVKDPVPHPYTQ
ncbi:hypothetical protein K438DRAFT_1970634 [Mycena galopus ATCC 62051]|nr:hypothetical protein K438DRAFT_1970634 [Mycena galopus ATCC 62051]